MRKYYMITNMSQLSLVKEHILQRGIDLKDLNGSYLYDAMFHPLTSKNREGYKRLLSLFESNDNKLYFDFINGSYARDMYGGDGEVVTVVTERYTL